MSTQRRPDADGPDGPDEGADGAGEAVAVPSAAAWQALGSDDWAVVLGHVRRALHALDDAEVTPRIARLRAAPAGRLAGGRPRAELARLLAGGGPAWQAVASRLEEAALPDPVADLLAGRTPHAGAEVPAPPDDRGAGVARAARLEADLERARERSRQLRAERDEARRRLEGTRARADRADARAVELEQELADARDRARDAEERLAATVTAQDRLVARERRRVEGELRDRDRRLSELRRQLDERDRAAARRGPDVARTPVTRATADRPRAVASDRLVVGRPSRLPDGVHPGTREAVDLLLHPGRWVLVDGYNLTKQHHPELDLARQRAWLVQLLGSLTARRKVRVTAVFDGAGAGSRPAAGNRDVSVRFTPDGVTADDELVLAVEASDDPVVAVTDDRELVGRLRAVGADVVGTRAFLWAAK